MKNVKGITLITLVITIVILIILAGVAINLSLGEKGIFNKAKEAKKAQVIAEAKEKIGTEILAAQVEAIERNEQLEQTQIADIVSNYGELQEDGDTIILNDDGYEVSLLDIYNGTVTSTGGYSELKAQNALLKQQLEDSSKSESEKSQELSELRSYLSDGKLLIASAITEKGVSTEADATLATMAENIGKIETNTELIFEGKIEYANAWYTTSNDSPGLASGSVTLEHDCIGWGKTSYSSVKGGSQYIKVNGVSVVSGTKSSGVFTAKKGDVVSWYGYYSGTGAGFIVALLY